jgi:hypothetical protein
MTEQLDIQPHSSTELATHQQPPDPVAQMINAVIERGVTADNVAAIEKLADLYERMQEKKSEREFAAAFVALQSDMPAISATKPVPNNDGTIRYTFAPYEAIMDQVRPVLQRHGFTVTFSSDVREGRVVQTCTLQHVGGHKRSNSFGARIGRGPPGSSEAQGDGAASTYAKRFALCDALNIVIDSDNDARSEGPAEVIAPDKALYLRELVKETESDEAAFLRFAGAKTYEEIAADRYAQLVAALNKKRR